MVQFYAPQSIPCFPHSSPVAMYWRAIAFKHSIALGVIGRKFKKKKTCQQFCTKNYKHFEREREWLKQPRHGTNNPVGRKTAIVWGRVRQLPFCLVIFFFACGPCRAAIADFLLARSHCLIDRLIGGGTLCSKCHCGSAGWVVNVVSSVVILWGFFSAYVVWDTSNFEAIVFS